MLGPDPRVDVLKVAHHGSRLQDERLLQALAPRAALVSVGADNTYGHPDPATVAQLRDLGALVFRTDEHGDVAVVGSATALRVVPRR
jgi:competence protein ComEC